MAIEALKTWHEIVRTRDASGLADLLADDVVFYSPVVHTAQTGMAITAKYLAAAVQVFGNDSFRYVREIAGDNDAVLEFETEIDGIIVNGVDMIKWNGNGKIVEFKVMVRPLKGINIIHQKMGEMLSYEIIEGGSANAHQRIQDWRKLHPHGYILNGRGQGDTFIHKADYCPHLGDADWSEDSDPGWPGMGKSTKVLAQRKEVLAAWAEESNHSVKRCSSCAP